ncbi:hybrid sensor histidine kinase/response regulator [Maricaulis sp.]|uniref:hybrid sensor histidine kinase/response regulator n=1 Tax=Maricaulis sp. TaxID=1486257 RepID=UPI00261AF9D0|nr:hybrid sensor histidine kinase/response regulator [Maricaulis sp.]
MTTDTSLEQSTLSDLVFDAIGDGLWDWDILADSIYRSPQCEAISGRPPMTERVPMALLEENVHPDDLALVQSRIAQALERDTQFTSDHRVIHLDGHTIWVQSRGRVVEYSDDGKPARMIGTLRDISERKRTEANLAESERRFTDLASNIPGAIFQYLQYPDGRNQVLYMSTGCEGIWEVSSDQVHEDASILWGMVVPEDLPAMQASVMKSAIELSPWVHSWRITTPSGKRKWLQGRGRPQPPRDDGAMLWNSLILDVTQTKQLELQLAESAKLEALGQLTGGIAHDFNNYLGIILGNLDLLSERVEMEDAHARLLQTAIRAAEHSAELTSDLLSFARRRTLEETRFEADSALSGIADMLQRSLGDQIDVQVELGCDDACIHTDKTQLETALINLANNARDAMPKGGTLLIKSRRIAGPDAASEDNPAQPHDYVAITLRDTGTGMDADTLAAATDPFFTTKPVGQGTGLGLSSAFGYAKQARGWMDIASEVGAGTTITLFLPEAEAAGEDDQATGLNTLPIATRNFRVLLVEDNPSLIESASAQLRDLGYQVTPAMDAATALAVLQSDDDRPDIMLSDVMLGDEQSGFDLAVIALDRGVPTVLTSGYPNRPSEAPQALPEDIPFVAKPYTRKQLASALSEALDRAAQAPAPT